MENGGADHSESSLPTGKATCSVGPVPGTLAEPARQGSKSAHGQVITAQYMLEEGGQGLQPVACTALSMPRVWVVSCALAPVQRKASRAGTSGEAMSVALSGPQKKCQEQAHPHTRLLAALPRPTSVSTAQQRGSALLLLNRQPKPYPPTIPLPLSTL